MRMLATLAAFCCALPAAAQTCSPDLPGGRKTDSAHYVLGYRAMPGPVVVGKPFNLDIVACPKGGASLPDKVAVDARMPEHGHGMNYRPAIKARGGGRFEAEGLMFHMPGRWEYVFDVQQGGTAERLTDSVVLQ